MSAKTIACLIGAALALSAASPASATFVLETSFGGSQKFFIDGENKKVTNFTGEVGAQKSGIFVDVSTVGAVDTGNGWSNIVPIKDGSLTTAVFTPENSNLFADFSTRGQLVAAGTFTFTVQDGQGNPAQTLTFDSGKDDDFLRAGIVSFDGETIKSVTLTGDFKELKQVEFSAPGAVPEPATWAMMLLGFATLGFAGYRRRRLAVA
jgi:hypothetical protein